jgi:hypothetical protein
MKYDFYARCKCRETGKIYYMAGKRKWGKLYFSADEFVTQAPTKSEAKRLAVANGSIVLRAGSL